MRLWKWVGLAGIVGVAAAAGTGYVIVRRRQRAWREYPPEELRDRLRARLADADAEATAS